MDEALTVAAPAPPEPDYPRHWEADVVASDGGVVHLRPMLPGDADAILAFHARLSERTRYLRYFGPYPHIPVRDLERFTVVDHHARVALVAWLGDEIIAVGRYEGRFGQDSTEVEGPAEVAFVVRDDHQSRGLGSILLEHLTAAARERGVRRFEAEVLAENGQMVRVFRDAGYQISREFAEGVLHLEFDIDPTERSMEVRGAREQRAEARSVHNVLHPRSIAVIGASTDPSKIGHAVLLHLLRGNFAGPVYPVNPEARSVRGVRAYPAVTDIPDDVDLAVIAVPAAGITEVLDSCLAKGVKALVVLSAGFADAGPDGVTAQHRLAEEARAHGMRVVGPNALGVANTDPQVRMNATLAPTMPAAGRVGFFSQSGALGIALLGTAAERGLGLSTFVSAGNRADLSGNDVLQYWQTDPATDVVLLYLESFGNPRKFARLARRLGRTKPIVAVKSGRWNETSAESAAAPVDESRVQALFEHSGVIRVQNVTQMFDTAQLLAYQPLPAGGRVAVVGNSTALNTAGRRRAARGGPRRCEPAGGRGHHREPHRPRGGRQRGGSVRRRRRARGGVRPAAGHVGHGARRGAARGGHGAGQTGGHHVPRQSGGARRAGRPRSGRCAGARVGTQLPVARAGRRRARAGRALRPLAQHPGGRERAARRDRRSGRAGAGRAAPRASTCSTTTSGPPCCVATASRCCRSGGSAARPTPSRPRPSSASPWRSRRPPSSGATASTAPGYG